MNVQVIYCNHTSAEIGVRERLSFSSGEQLDRAYGKLRSSFPASELVVLSTCNRVELYTAQQDTQQAPSREQIAEFFSDFHQLPVEQFSGDLLAQSGSEAVRHLFSVASSLDSMVLGEPQIVNQIKEAYRVAQEHDACGPLTHALFQGAMRVSARVRSETRLSEGRVSIASVAVGDFGKSIFDRFDDKTVLIIGAGEMAEETLRYLKADGTGRVFVINRSLDRARELAVAWGGEARPMAELQRWMAEADVIVSTTGSDRPIVTAAQFAELRRNSGEKPVFILDIGAPRDFEPAIGGLDENVFLYDIGDLEATCRRNREARAREVERAERIVDEETERFMHDIYHQATGPIIKRLREEWHDVCDDEVRRLFARLSHLEDEDRSEVQRTIERIVNKLLHPPLEALRYEARQGAPDGLLDALKRLFRLSE